MPVSQVVPMLPGKIGSRSVYPDGNEVRADVLWVREVVLAGEFVCICVSVSDFVSACCVSVPEFSFSQISSEMLAGLVSSPGIYDSKVSDEFSGSDKSEAKSGIENIIKTGKSKTARRRNFIEPPKKFGYKRMLTKKHQDCQLFLQDLFLRDFVVTFIKTANDCIKKEKTVVNVLTKSCEIFDFDHKMLKKTLHKWGIAFGCFVD
jgi:hypothetical protein